MTLRADRIGYIDVNSIPKNQRPATHELKMAMFDGKRAGSSDAALNQEFNPPAFGSNHSIHLDIAARLSYVKAFDEVLQNNE